MLSHAFELDANIAKFVYHGKNILEKSKYRLQDFSSLPYSRTNMFLL